MKRYLCFLPLLLLAACSNPGVTPSGSNTSAYKPILISKDVLDNSVTFQPSADLNNPGKIYTAGNYLYVSERYKGVHVYDNTDPKNPQQKVFISVPGSLDMAVKGNVLYADNATDLVAVDISDPQNPKVVSRTKNVFPEITTPPDGLPLDGGYTQNRPANTIIIGWSKIK